MGVGGVEGIEGVDRCGVCGGGGGGVVFFFLCVGWGLWEMLFFFGLERYL